MKILLLICLFATGIGVNSQAQKAPLMIIDSGRNCSIRGMSIAGDGSVWISGSHGQVAKSTDMGDTWRWMVVPGYEKTDFRDIHAFNSVTAVIMGVGNPAYILKTRDGGRTWKPVYTKDTTGMFLDAMDFHNDRDGICIGDPIDAGGGLLAFFILRTADGGDTWREEPAEKRPSAQAGEAVFSASGTNIILLQSRDIDYAFISGGVASNLYLAGRKGRPVQVLPLDIAKGHESSGAFSLATDREKTFYCIGGDYMNPQSTSKNFTWTANYGRSWRAPGPAAPSGYRSCIRIIDGQQLVACGTNGVDLCSEPGTWERVSGEGFNVCAVSPDKKMIYFGGGKGRIGLLRL